MWQDGNILRIPTTHTKRPGKKNTNEIEIEMVMSMSMHPSTQDLKTHFIMFCYPRNQEKNVHMWIPQDWNWSAGGWSWLTWLSSMSWSGWRSGKGWRGSCSGDSAFLWKWLRSKWVAAWGRSSLEINENGRCHEESHEANWVAHEVNVGENLSKIFYILYDNWQIVL